MRRTAITLLMALLSLLVPGCGGTAGSDSSSGTANRPIITLAVNSWTASAFNAQVAKVIIEQELGNEVRLVDVGPDEMIRRLADGSVDAALEIWPASIDDAEAKRFDGEIERLGDLGTVGRIGWYVPDYVLQAIPEAATWEGLRDPEVARRFATADTGTLGRFLGTEQSYSQHDETLIRQLGLPFEVKYSGSEAATIGELDSRVARREPILLYWWTPTASATRYGLTRVALPPYTEECGADAERIACDYPEDVLFKAASTGLRVKDERVHRLLQRFTITNADQESALPAAELDQMPVERVAHEWVERHQVVWQAWLG